MYLNENERSRDQKLNVQEGSILLYVNVKSSIAIFFFYELSVFWNSLKTYPENKNFVRTKKKIPYKIGSINKVLTFF